MNVNRSHRFFLLVFVLIFSAQGIVAQEITVIDHLTQQRIPEVKIACADGSVKKKSNNEGRFRLEPFFGCDSIYISYSNYQRAGFTLEELKQIVTVELDEDPIFFNEMTVTANRWEKEQSEVPNKITRLNLKKIELLAPQTAADLLESSGYVFVQKSQLAGGSPQLRGFGTNRVMIIIDGVRMNNAIFRSGNLQNIISIDPNALESAEVLFGPGAVMYGSDAIGGVMDFRTKEPLLALDSAKYNSQLNYYSRYSSANSEFTNHVDYNIGGGRLASLTSFTYSIFGDLKAGKSGNQSFLRPNYQETTDGIDFTLVNDEPRVQRNSGYDQLNITQKLLFNVSDETRIEYAFNYAITSDAPRYDRLLRDSNNDGELDFAEWFYGPQKWMMNRFTIYNSPESSILADDMRLTIAHQNFQESRHDRKMGSETMRRQFENLNAISVNLDLDKTLSARSELFYGLEGVINKVSSNAYREDIYNSDRMEINPRYPDGSLWAVYGGYLNSRYHMNDKWILNTGIRYSIYQMNAKFDTTLFEYPITESNTTRSSLNGSIGIVYNPSERTQFYMNSSTGFRAPNIDDIGKVFDSEPGRVIVPNPDLKPETAYNAEVGFMKVIKNSVKLDAALYYTYLDNALARTFYSLNGQDSILYDGEMSQVQALQNVSNAYVYGAQGGVEVFLPKGISIFSKISFQKGFDYINDSLAYFPKSHITPLFGRSGVTYTRKQVRIEFYSVYHDKVEFEELPLGERGDVVYARDAEGKNFTPAWFTLNLKGTVYFNKYLSATFGIENITDQLYRVSGSGISAPGRNYIISLKVRL
jgi:hemoglobin/transferrin/lactoferrin receptor protein